MGYRELNVWQRSMIIVKRIYALTTPFPQTEIYGLALQMRKCAVSIPSNLAEGSRKGTKKDYKRFVRTAMGSAAELETQLEISRDLQFISEENYKLVNSELDTVIRMLTRLEVALRPSPKTYL